MIKELGSHNPDGSLLLAEKYNTSFIDEGVEYGASSINVTWEKSDFLVEFQIRQPNDPPTICRILPPKHFISIIGKGIRQHRLKSI